MMAAWVSGIVSYYALQLNAQNLAGDIFTNFIVSGLVDVPAIATVFFLVDRLGRRRMLTLGLSGLGCCCLVMAFISKENDSLVLVVYLLGKYFASCSTNTNWLYTAELYPTNLRSQALGMCSMISRIFGMTSPFVAELSSLWSPLPMLVLGVPSLLTASAVLGTMPETTGRPLPETFEEALELEVWQSSRIPHYRLPRSQFVLSEEDDADEVASSASSETIFLEEAESLLEK